MSDNGLSSHGLNIDTRGVVYHCHTGNLFHSTNTYICGDCVPIGSVVTQDELIGFFAYHGVGDTQAYLDSFPTEYRAMLAIAVAAEDEYIANSEATHARSA